MKITKQQLIDMGACQDGLERFIKQTGNTEQPVEVSSLIGGINTYSDLLWLAGKTKPREEIVRFAKDCALINIELIKPYTNSYDLIVEFLKSDDVDAAAYAAAYAAYAAADAATDDADDAADAAYAAAAAAWAAARDAAAWAAACDAVAADAGNQEKVNELLKGLLKC